MSLRDNTSLSWSWLRGYRFEAIAVLVVVICLAAGGVGSIGTLDHLSVELFRHEVMLAVNCIAEAGEEQSEKLAQSFGL